MTIRRMSEDSPLYHMVLLTRNVAALILMRRKKKKEVEGSPAKRHKGPVADLGAFMEPKLQAEKMSRKSKIPSPSKKGVLSLTRLNMLARPKLRK